jgi:hypothetical protein
MAPVDLTQQETTCRPFLAENRSAHEGLNVVKSWNGANDFILYGRGCSATIKVRFYCLMQGCSPGPMYCLIRNAPVARVSSPSRPWGSRQPLA